MFDPKGELYAVTARRRACTARPSPTSPPTTRRPTVPGVARQILMNDDVMYNIAVLLGTLGKTMNPMASGELAAFIATTEVTRSGILSTAQAFIKLFLSPRMASALCTSTFDIRGVVGGDPLTTYMILPPDKSKDTRRY